MKIFYLLTVVYLGVMSSPVFAEGESHVSKSDMHINSSMSMQGKKDCDKMSMMNPQKMKGMMQMRKKHMQKMEKHLANIENLLKQLLELQKKEHSVQ